MHIKQLAINAAIVGYKAMSLVLAGYLKDP